MRCDDCEVAFSDPMVLAALLRVMREHDCGAITFKEYQSWMWRIIHEPVILCPICNDWEDVYDSEQIEKLGAYWCCTMCELAGNGPWARPE